MKPTTILIALLATLATLPAQLRVPVTVEITGAVTAPTNFFGSNVMAGDNITVTQLGDGRVQINGHGTNGLAHASDVTAATNSPLGTNWINQRQPASTVLSNISGLAGAYTISAAEWAMNVDDIGEGGINFTMDAYDITLSLTNRGGSAAGIRYVGISNGVPWDFWLEDLPGSIASRQGGSAVLTNLAGTGALTNSSQFVASSGGLATNLNIKAAVGTSLALTVNTNTLVVTNGRVGVLTNSPGYELQVAGTNAGTAFIATKTGSASAPAYQFSDGRGFFQDGTGGGGGIGVSPSGAARITLGNVGVEMGSGLYVGWSSASSPNNSPDIFFYRHGTKTNGVSGVSGSSTPTGSIMASNYIAHGVISIKAKTATNTPPAGHAGLFAATNSGTVELMAIDSAGNVTQISPHAMDSPGLAADNSPLPMIIRHRNEYAGVEEWIHLSKLARAVEQLTGQRFIYTNAVAKRDWQADQDAEQAAWNTARSAEIAARSGGDTNVTVRPARDVRQSTPGWLRNRGQR